MWLYETFYTIIGIIDQLLAVFREYIGQSENWLPLLWLLAW